MGKEDGQEWWTTTLPFARKDKPQEKWQAGNHANAITWQAAPRYTMPRGGKTKTTEVQILEDKSKNSKFKLGGGGRTTFIDKYVMNAMETPGPGKYRTESQFRKKGAEKDEVDTCKLTMDASPNYSFMKYCKETTYPQIVRSTNKPSCMFVGKRGLATKGENLQVTPGPGSTHTHTQFGAASGGAPYNNYY